MAKTIEKKQLDILQHKLVPNHVILSDKEKKDFLEKLKITPDQLPKIINTDPVAMYIDAKPGQIVKIIRKSHTAKEAVAYRLVVESNE
ncbi:MAG: DNA-directed RNA polymerase subunit H [Thermoplasmatales archaeon SG8-52-3]|nr:MAG: DNA-directed RNA polymerase subunit H [Thermoplasmatales archaeon SG8-52-3]